MIVALSFTLSDLCMTQVLWLQPLILLRKGPKCNNTMNVYAAAAAADDDDDTRKASQARQKLCANRKKLGEYAPPSYEKDVLLAD